MIGCDLSRGAGAGGEGKQEFVSRVLGVGGVYNRYEWKIDSVGSIATRHMCPIYPDTCAPHTHSCVYHSNMGILVHVPW